MLFERKSRLRSRKTPMLTSQMSMVVAIGLSLAILLVAWSLYRLELNDSALLGDTFNILTSVGTVIGIVLVYETLRQMQREHAEWSVAVDEQAKERRADESIDKFLHSTNEQLLNSDGNKRLSHVVQQYLGNCKSPKFYAEKEIKALSPEYFLRSRLSAIELNALALEGSKVSDISFYNGLADLNLHLYSLEARTRFLYWEKYLWQVIETISRCKDASFRSDCVSRLFLDLTEYAQVIFVWSVVRCTKETITDVVRESKIISFETLPVAMKILWYPIDRIINTTTLTELGQKRFGRPIQANGMDTFNTMLVYCKFREFLEGFEETKRFEKADLTQEHYSRLKYLAVLGFLGLKDEKIRNNNASFETEVVTATKSELTIQVENLLCCLPPSRSRCQ